MSSQTTPSTPDFEGNGFKMKPIEVKPSTELISDEYEHKDNSKGLVLVFRSRKERSNCAKVEETFEKYKYKVKNNVFPLDTRVNVKKKLQEITSKEHNDKTCLVLFFLARTNKEKQRGLLLMDNGDEISLKEVWNMFVTLKSFRNKPKVFIFQGTDFSEGVTTDSYSHGASNYDVPIEADLFIVYNHAKSTRDQFIPQLCDNIRDRGERDDLIDLIIYNNPYNVPLMISTLTRRFYLRQSVLRGCYLDQYPTDSENTTSIDNVKAKVTQMKNDRDIANEKAKMAQMMKDKSFRGSCSSLGEEKGPRRHSSFTKPEIEALDVPEGGQRKERRRNSSINLDVPPTPRPRANSKGKKPHWKP